MNLEAMKVDQLRNAEVFLHLVYDRPEGSEVAVDRAVAAVTRADLAAELGYSNHKSGGFSGPVGRLSSMGFIEAGGGTLEAAETCWLPGRAPR